MTASRARFVLLCNAAGATVYAVLHLYLAWRRSLPVNINFVLLVALAIVAFLATRLKEHHLALAVYSAALWFAIMVMVVYYAGDPRCTGVPDVTLWLALGAVIAGMSGNRAGIIYVYLSTVSFLWIVLVYSDVGYALIRWPLLPGAALVGWIFREYEELKGQINKLETALRIVNNAPKGRESP